MFGYLGHSLGNKGMTCDSSGVIPGMVYIDLDSKNRKGIYNASKNGASLIISSRCVADPSIPLIKVKDIERTYFSLLDILYGRPVDKAKFIYVYGGNKAKLVVRLLEAIFAKHFSKSIEIKELRDFTYALISQRINSAAERFFCYILLNLSSNIAVIPLNYSDDLARFHPVLKAGHDCSVLIDECPVQETAANIGFGKPLFINIDDPHNLKAIDEHNDSIVITYGLNKKAAVTATSIEYGEITKFNYCLQRTFCSKSGVTLEPFEVPISIKGLGLSKIYSALAAISCALYYDVAIESIKDALFQFDDKDRDFSIVKYDSFTLIDSYCITERDYREAFEMMPMLGYRNLHIIIPGQSACHKGLYNIILDLINEWGTSLNIKELAILSGVGSDVSFGSPELLKDIEVSYFGQLSKAIESSLKYLSDKDVLLILGGDEMNSSQCIIELMLEK